MGGIPARDLWDLIVSVLHGNTHQSNQERRDPHKFPTQKKIHGKIDVLDNVDFISANADSSRKEALLKIFDDNEAVIKMIMEGRSPNLRHVSRTHRVALDWWFDRINSDPKILTRYVDSKNRLEDISHVMNGTTFYVCSILAFSALKAALRSILKIALKLCRRDHKKCDYDERVVAKSKPVRNLLSRICTGPSTTPFSTVSSCPGKFVSEDREMRFETKTGKPSSNNQQENLNKPYPATNSQERHEETRSRATTELPMTQKPSQTEDFTACTFYFVPTIKSWDADSGLKTKEDCDILSARSLSSTEEVDEHLIEEFRENQNSWKSFLEAEIPVHDRVWIDIEPLVFARLCPLARAVLFSSSYSRGMKSSPQRQRGSGLPAPSPPKTQKLPTFCRAGWVGRKHWTSSARPALPP